jgi:alpha-tubulin suppressor-like RCC1 family protein
LAEALPVRRILLILVCFAATLAASACKRRAPRVRAIAAGHGHACALIEDGTVRCWGFNDQGQLGSGDTQARAVPTQVPGLHGVVQLALAENSSCALLADGTARCWGWNLRGQIGGGRTEQPRTAPAPVPGLSGAVQIALGESHGCARLRDETVRCWGDNSAGEVGDSSGTRRTAATVVIDPQSGGPLTGVTSLALGMSHSCALMKDATVRCWGLDNLGQLGTGPGAEGLWRHVPTQVVGLLGVEQIAASQYLSCALLASSTVQCWGKNVGEDHSTDVPVPVEGLTRPTRISVGPFGSACARIDGGSLRCWGSDAAAKWRVDSIEEVALGWGFGCARSAEGDVECWGDNDHGSLGDGTLSSRHESKAVKW